MLPELQQSLRIELADLAARDRLRTLPAIAGSSRIRASVSGQTLVNFCSNDYLGLANHPQLIAAARQATSLYGYGAAASRLVSGDLPPHRHFEAAIAAFLDRPTALLFPTGYQANIGALTALAGEEDFIASDALNHASLIDGCRLSRAKVRVFAHGNPDHAEDILTSEEARRSRRRFLVTESVFSMDGDVAPLRALAKIAAATATSLFVDEAHAIGVAGPKGKGIAALLGVVPDVIVGTLGKAFGAAGGFVSGVPELRAILENRARTFLFTTASPPSVAAAATAALDIIKSTAGDDLRDALNANIQRLRHGLSTRASVHALSPLAPATPIVPVVLGPDLAAVTVSRALRAEGFFVQAIRPPTVPEGTARLRITLSAAHTADDIDALLAACSRSLP